VLVMAAGAPEKHLVHAPTLHRAYDPERA
jgi:hypothetical protein